MRRSDRVRAFPMPGEVCQAFGRGVRFANRRERQRPGGGLPVELQMILTLGVGGHRLLESPPFTGGLMSLSPTCRVSFSRLAILFFAALLLVWPSRLGAQTVTGTLQGTVTDT